MTSDTWYLKTWYAVINKEPDWRSCTPSRSITTIWTIIRVIIMIKHVIARAREPTKEGCPVIYIQCSKRYLIHQKLQNISNNQIYQIIRRAHTPRPRWWWASNVAQRKHRRFSKRGTKNRQGRNAHSLWKRTNISAFRATKTDWLTAVVDRDKLI